MEPDWGNLHENQFRGRGSELIMTKVSISPKFSDLLTWDETGIDQRLKCLSHQ
jgi:hypothetical protein